MTITEQSTTSGRLRSFDGSGYLHLPFDAGDPLDFDSLEDEENRWNRRGNPTLYLACDPAVALAEFARHCRPDEADRTIRRRLFRFDLHLERLVDLVPPGPDGVRPGMFEPVKWLDRDQARRVAESYRAHPSVLGLVVPSVAFLDDPTRFNLALFVDRLDPRPGGWLRSVTEVGRLEVDLSA